MRAFLETTGLFVRAADAHLRHFAPTAERMAPRQYSGKAENTCAILAMDVVGVKIGDSPDPEQFARFITGLNLLVRANDEVLDEIMPYSDEPVTPEALNTTPVFHKFAEPGGRHVTGAEGMDIAMAATAKLIPGSSPGALGRRSFVEETLKGITATLADTANNPEYNQGTILPYPLAERVKYATTGMLGESCISLVEVLFGVPERDNSRELYGHMGIALQLGDDLFDWRRDWRKYIARAESSDRPVRPQENLFNAILLEFADERQACEAVLTDTEQRSVVLAREVAPDSYDTFQDRFRDVLSRYPDDHPYTPKARRVSDFIINRVVPHAPETGKFSEWAKY